MWTRGDSNPRPLACKAGVLPAELASRFVVSPGFEPRNAAPKTVVLPLHYETNAGIIGLEPITYWLTANCSTIELYSHGGESKIRTCGRISPTKVYKTLVITFILRRRVTASNFTAKPLINFYGFQYVKELHAE